MTTDLVFSSCAIFALSLSLVATEMASLEIPAAAGKANTAAVVAAGAAEAKKEAEIPLELVAH